MELVILASSNGLLQKGINLVFCGGRGKDGKR